MKHPYFFSACLLILFSASIMAQENSSAKSVTDPYKGCSTVYSSEAISCKAAQAVTDINILWEKHEAAAIGEDAYLSAEAENITVNWQLNNRRITKYDNAGNVGWEVSTNYDFAFSRMNKKGSLVLISDETMLYAVNAVTGEILWQKNMLGFVKAFAPYPDGTGFYVGINDRNDVDYAESYTLDSEDPVWSFATANNIVTMNISENNEHLVVCLSQPAATALVVEPSSGDILQELYYYCNSPTQPPAFDSDGEYMVITGFNGKASLYKWDNTLYEEVWTASVAAAGSTSTWGQGCAISADGSTIAIGTLGFTSSGYWGSVFLFNNYSAEPLWSYNDCGDMAAWLSLTDDGSLIACATWGPMNHSSADLLIFRKESSTPISSLNTTGSLESVDLYGDGSLGIVAGKAVHNRAMGSGGQFYCFDPRPANSGSLDGIVDLLDTDNDSDALISIEGLDDYYDYSLTDGSFIIKYIPAGSYTITVSKTGYYPMQLENVTISAENTTTVDAELTPTGAATTGLFASQGSALYVSLSWNEFSTTCNGYNIYRKRNIADPYSEILATVNADEISYIDEEVIPTYNYYYAVSAIIEGNIESPLSNTALGFATTAYITHTIDVYEGSLPTIDGVMEEGEWDDAFKLESSDFLGQDGSIQPPMSVTTYFKSCGDYLYIAAVNTNDSELGDNDRVAFYMDDNNNGTYEPSGDNSEGNYWMDCTANGSGTIRYRPIYEGQSVGDAVYLDDPQIAASDASGSVVIEFALPIGGEDFEITPNNANECGLYLYIRNSSIGDYDGYWPYDNTETFIPTGYGTIKFYATDEVPPAPENLRYDEELLGTMPFVPVSWDMPKINDFDHFNVFVTSTPTGGKDDPLMSVEGTQALIDIEEETKYDVYVTTVDRGGNESVPSETLSFTIETVGLEDALITNIYPNPASDIVYIDSENTTDITIYNLSGQLIKEIKECSSFSVKGMKTGVYFMIVKVEKKAMVKKLIVE